MGLEGLTCRSCPGREVSLLGRKEQPSFLEFRACKAIANHPKRWYYDSGQG